MARFLLDTNVLSEMARHLPAPEVTGWLRATPPQDVATSIMVIGEILEGVLRLEAHGATRATALRAWLAEVEATHLVLPVDDPVIREWARLRTSFPPSLDFEDTLIAATAAAHRLTVVTRNIRDFAVFGVPLLNPWEWRP